jgi:hypothetical protein
MKVRGFGVLGEMLWSSWCVDLGNKFAAVQQARQRQAHKYLLLLCLIYKAAFLESHAHHDKRTNVVLSAFQAEVRGFGLQLSLQLMQR